MIYAEAEHLDFPEEDQFAVPLDGVSLLDLRDRQCRWPLGDRIEPATRFCGHDALTGDSYCPTHRAAAYPPRAVSVPAARDRAL